jgi:hypothetical protein
MLSEAFSSESERRRLIGTRIPKNKDIEYGDAVPVVQALFLSERMRGHKIKTEYQQAVEHDELNVHLPLSAQDILDIENEDGRHAMTGVKPITLQSTGGKLFLNSSSGGFRPQQIQNGQVIGGKYFMGKYFPEAHDKKLHDLATFVDPNIVSKSEKIYKRFIKPAHERPSKMSLSEAQAIKIDRHRPLLPTIFY